MIHWKYLCIVLMLMFCFIVVSIFNAFILYLFIVRWPWVTWTAPPNKMYYYYYYYYSEQIENGTTSANPFYIAQPSYNIMQISIKAQVWKKKLYLQQSETIFSEIRPENICVRGNFFLTNSQLNKITHSFSQHTLYIQIFVSSMQAYGWKSW